VTVIFASFPSLVIYLVTSSSKLPLEYEGNPILGQHIGLKQSYGIVDSSAQVPDIRATAEALMS